MRTLREVYDKLLREYKHKFMVCAEPYPITQDKANRMAAIWAVKNTQKEWRAQNDNIYVKN